MSAVVRGGRAGRPPGPGVGLGVVGLATAVGAVTAAASAAGFAGGVWWRFDLAANFRIQYAIVLVAVAVILTALRRLRLAVVFAILATPNLVILAPLYTGKPVVSSAAIDSATRLRVLLVNVNTGNTRYADGIAEILRHDPDMVLVEELNWRWWEALFALDDRYPHSLTRPEHGVFGIGLYSKHPIVEGDILPIGAPYLTSVRAELAVDGQRLTVIGVHPPPPVQAELARARDDQLAALPAMVDEIDTPVVLVGDLNASPWSHAFRRLLRETRLHDSARGFGYQPTWPMLPTWQWPLRIPIDHCLHSPHLVALDRQLGHPIGSDHRPLIVDLAIRGHPDLSSSSLVPGEHVSERQRENQR